MDKKNPGTKEEGWAGQQGQSGGIDHGCRNNCPYCYARLDKCDRYKIMPWEDWDKPFPRKTPFPMVKLEKPNRVMFPSTHDIHPTNLDRVIETCEKILEFGNNLLIVSKPNYDCIQKLGKELLPWYNRIEFRFSIGSIDDRITRKLEPNAPLFKERMRCVRFAYACRYTTSISIEPYLDAHPEYIVKEVDPYVSSIWVGTMNHIKEISVHYPEINLVSWLYVPERVKRIKEQLDALNNEKIKYKKPFLEKLKELE